MRAAVVVALATLGCGGGSKASSSPKPVEPVHRTRTIPVEDTEPDDGVEIVHARGRMDPAVVDAALAPHKGDMSECYTSRVGRRRWLGGQVSLHWDINKEGEVTKVLLAESNLGAWPVEKCLLDIARAASFGKPIGGDADFSVPLDFGMKGKAADWDEIQALKAVGSRQLAKLDECAKAKGVKSLPDDVLITLYVGPQGKTQSVGFASAKTPLDDAWAECAQKAAMAWKLPDPRGQIAKLAVKYR